MKQHLSDGKGNRFCDEPVPDGYGFMVCEADNEVIQGNRASMCPICLKNAAPSDPHDDIAKPRKGWAFTGPGYGE